MMRALTVAPNVANSARVEDVPEPPSSDGAVLVRTLALGVCGTDREIVSGRYGWAPPGETRLVIGHESLGKVQEAPANAGVKVGDLVVGIVRRPDPVPCHACAVGEWDMCRNGRYTERGIKERHGYGADFFRVEPDFLVKIDQSLGMAGVLVEPTSIVAKAWDHTERIGRRSRSWQPKTLLVTGAGPIGLLAALMGAQRGLEVHVLDHHESLDKKVLVRELNGTFHAGSLANLGPLAARYPDGVHRRAKRGARRARPHRSGRHRLSGRRQRARPDLRRRYRLAQSHDGARQRCRVWQRQCQPQAL